MLKIYRILFPIFFIPTILLLSIFSKKIRSGFFQKFGRYNFKNKEKTLWIHAVSVGEVLAIADFISQNQNEKITLTTSTPQGQELAQKKLGNFCKEICYFPYDCTFSIKNAIKAINPSRVMIVETEIWPNFIYLLNKAKVPVIIANGRISDRTFQSYRKAKIFFKEVFKNFHSVLAQSKDDAEKFIQIGANANIVKTMGNVKFDIQRPSDEIKNQLIKLYEKENCKLIIAGSTHNGEEKIILEAYKNLKKEIPNLKLIIAPRHLERICEVEVTLKGENFALKSENPSLKENDIIILNTTGELGNLYSIADIAFIGGSFNKTGGHNPLEATIWKKPAISGPNVKNFRIIYQELVDNNCAKIVKDGLQLEKTLKKILTENAYYTELCTKCEQVLVKNQGATKFLKKYIEELNYGN